tara:strand:- start:265 stop:576 length:312 start_codon:yes stop_codon:yes gene_type:complete
MEDPKYYNYDVLVYIGDIENPTEQYSIENLVFANPIGIEESVFARRPDSQLAVNLGRVAHVQHFSGLGYINPTTILHTFRKSTDPDFLDYIKNREDESNPPKN